MAGPLAGLTIIEMAGLGPGPFAGMLLADHGARVIRIERKGAQRAAWKTMGRSREVIQLDLKSEHDIETLLALALQADVLFEGFRPGVMERLGIGPDRLMGVNPRLIYARVTGWGQQGPRASSAGHDLNYIALSGAAHAVGSADQPYPPLMLAGDLGGGGMLLAFGILAALLETRQSGLGQVIDCAMVDGAALLMTPMYEMFAKGDWRDERAANLLDGGAPHYAVYETADSKFISIAPLEPQFYLEFLRRIGLAGDPDFANASDRAAWPVMRDRLRAIFISRSRADWCELLDDGDACFAPVLSLAEAPLHEQARARRSFIEVDGIVQPAPAPRYSRSALDVPTPPRTYDDLAKLAS